MTTQTKTEIERQIEQQARDAKPAAEKDAQLDTRDSKRFTGYNCCGRNACGPDDVQLDTRVSKRARYV